MIKYEEFITPEEYMELRKMVEASISKLKDGMKPGYKVKLTLNSAKGKEPFYEKFGFRVRPNDDAGSGMDQWLIMDET